MSITETERKSNKKINDYVLTTISFINKLLTFSRKLGIVQRICKRLHEIVENYFDVTKFHTHLLS